MKMEQTGCFETLAFKLQTPGNNPEESRRYLEHGESLKSRLCILPTSHFCSVMNVVQSKTEPEVAAFQTYHQQGFMEITAGQTTANKFQSLLP
jgi:hypothetical protein